MKFFLFDFEGNYFIEDVEKLEDVYFSFPSTARLPEKTKKKQLIFSKHPVSFEKYQKAFREVIEEIRNGNTYLLNLTFPTKIETNYSLLDIFNHSNAKFKLLFKDKFVCFSPERFVTIKNGKIYTYPMKGTIDASIPQAKELILNNQKEMAEHTMVVDLLRNDLGIIARNIKVNKFRFVDKIKAGNKELLQVSSEIEGTLANNWRKNWIKLFKKLLPAGSVTGTPKKSSVEIIKRVENYDRGFYTGVFGIIDEEKGFLDSAVIIRYVEKTKDGLIYKSGGGITIDSSIIREYEELIDKVYIPI